MFISIVDLDWWSWNSSQVSSGPFKELLGNSWYLSLRSTLGKERERKWGKERKKKRGRRRKKLPWALLTFLLLFAGCYLIHNPLLPTTVGPPNPRFCLLGFNQLQIENIQEKEKFKKVPKSKTWIYCVPATIYTAFTLYLNYLHSIYILVLGTISNLEII